MSKLQIGIPCGPNSESYVNFLIENIIRTVSDVDNVEILLGINKPNLDIDFMTQYRDVLDIKVVEAISEYYLSLGHGHCLDTMFEHMDSEYAMIVDCDVAFLQKDWDIKLINELKDDVVIIGAGTEISHHHYYDFPFTITTLFKVAPLKEVGVSFMPKLKDIILTEENAEVFGRNPGDKIHLDTAWELPYKLKPAGYSGKALPIISPRVSKDEVVFLSDNMRGEEHHLNGVPIFTHVGRSSNRDFHRDPVVTTWTARVENWVDNLDKILENKNDKV